MAGVQKISNGLPKLSKALEIAKNNPETHRVMHYFEKGRGKTTSIFRVTEGDVKISRYNNKTGEITKSGHIVNDFVVVKNHDNGFMISEIKNPDKKSFVKFKDFPEMLKYFREKLSILKSM